MTVARPIIVVFLGLMIALGASAERAVRAQDDVPVKTLVARTADYVARYQDEFSTLVADELYTQRASGAGTQERVIRGELFLTYITAERVWMALHDVAEVDGQPVPDRDDLRALLGRGPTQALGRELARRNARFNIGGIFRNFNEPTFALQVVSARHMARFDFRRGRTALDAGQVPGLVALDFQSRRDETIVHNPSGEAVAMRGTITVEAATGGVRATRLTLRDAGTNAELRTYYEHDAKTALWVPTSLAERYERRVGNRVEVITAYSTYTNYRRFQASGRVK